VSEKYEREIEEILRKMSFSAPSRRRQTSGWMAGIAAGWQRSAADLSPTRLFALGIILALVAWLCAEAALGLAGPLSLLAVVFLVWGFALSLSRRNARRSSGWRGRSFDESPSGAELWASLKRRWEKWRRHRGGHDPRWN
jgi:hypothetical protein